MLDIVAISTIADVVSLTNENRALTKAGLEMINKEEKLIWKVMERFSARTFAEITNVDSRTIAFTYAPAINMFKNTWINRVAYTTVYVGGR